MMAGTPAEWLHQARVRMQAGDAAGARKLLEDGCKEHPTDAALAHAVGDLAIKAGELDAAEAYFGQAAKNAPDNIEFTVNHAIALQRLGRPGKAIAALEPLETVGIGHAKYCSVRASCERDRRSLSEAAHWYDHAIKANPTHAKALHGRARVAMERGEADTVARFDRALAANQGDGDLWLGKAQALDVAGNIAGARAIAQQIADQAPSFLPGQNLLAQLRLAAGEKDFASHYAKAAAKHPQDPNIPAAHCEILAGLDYAAEAAEVAAQARRTFPDVPHFTLLEAVHAGSAGQWQRAEAIFSEMAATSPLRSLHEARHRLRAGDPGTAEKLLEEVLDDEPWSISAWALRGITWRLKADPRADWLHEQAGLVQLRRLVGAEDLVARATEFLRELHAGSAMPLGQSLRGGTQTRGILFHRTEPVLAELEEAIHATLEEYRNELTEPDPTHPLLRHRDTPWRLEGSWSVRLTGGGDYHTAHIHPQGIISSALYLVVPEDAVGDEHKGWLEVGRPPPDLRLDLPPLQTIQPKPGHLALFPSTLYHGTTAFGAAERMTVAFDVVTKTGE